MISNPFLIMLAAAGIVLATQSHSIDVSLPPVSPLSEEKVVLMAHLEYSPDVKPELYEDLMKMLPDNSAPQAFLRDDCEAYKMTLMSQLIQQLAMRGINFVDLEVFCFTQEEYNKHVKQSHKIKGPSI
jgi:hypothetical protein